MTDLPLDPSDGLIVFTDGSANYQDRSGGWAWVALDGHEGTEENSGAEFDATVNRMELTAVIEALAHLRDAYGPCEILVKSDSQYVVLGYSDPSRVRKVNKDLWAILDEEAAQHTLVVMEHVRGHQGHTWNEKADRLAGQARRELVETSSA